MNTIITELTPAKTVLEKALSYLGMDDVTVAVHISPRMLDKLTEAGVELTAATFPSALEKTYNLYLRHRNVRDIVLCHEAVHVGQYASGRLALDGNGQAVWMGVPYDNDTPYRSRPWEIEAFGMERSIMRNIRHK